MARDPAADAGVLARPFESGAAARLAGVVNLDAIELVLQPAIAAGRGQLARDHRPAATSKVPVRQHARRGRNESPTGIGVRRAQVALRTGTSQHAYLPDRLNARGRIDADRALDQIGMLQMRDLPIPHIEKDE